MSFIKRKALINILVHFQQINALKSLTNSYIKYIIDSIQKSINNLYGNNRFIVYNVNEADLKTNTRLLSAKALLIVTNNNNQDENDLNFIRSINLEKLILDYNQLLSSSSVTANDLNETSTKNFNYEYFNQQIRKLIPQSNCAIDQPKPKQNDDTTVTYDNRMYLFDSNNHLYYLWSHLSALKLKEFSNEIINHEDNQDDDDGSMVVYCDSNQIEMISKYQQNGLKKINFDLKAYFDHLKTKTIGRSLLFQNITETTMKMATNVSKINGIVTTANYQTTGLGRSDNQWLSPFGCAMFTINLHIPYTNNLIISKITLLQHLASLSVVLAIPSSDELNIRIKWPNDILLMPCGSKLSGILVRSYSYEFHFNIQIGIGVNVSNRQPSICLDEIIENYNAKHKNLSGSSELKKIAREEIMARILNTFEHLYQMLLKGQLNEIKQLYCSYWIHDGDIVDIYDQDELGHHENCHGTEHNQIANQKPEEKIPTHKARIVGIDDNGYLLAKDIDDQNLIHCLQPDSNRFDLMNRLLIQKNHIYNQ